MNYSIDNSHRSSIRKSCLRTRRSTIISCPAVTLFEYRDDANYNFAVGQRSKQFFLCGSIPSFCVIKSKISCVACPAAELFFSCYQRSDLHFAYDVPFSFPSYPTKSLLPKFQTDYFISDQNLQILCFLLLFLGYFWRVALL